MSTPSDGPGTIPTDGRTVAAIKEELDRRLFDRHGVICPCCDRLAAVYRRSISPATVGVLVAMERRHRAGEAWVYISDGPGGLHTPGGDYAKTRWWGLIERQEGVREDGSPRTGYWRLTPDGLAFLLGDLAVPKYLYEYNSTVVEAPLDVVVPTMRVHQIVAGFDLRTLLATERRP